MEERFIETLGVRMHYRIGGEGDHTIILMHGWGCQASTLALVEKACLEAGWRVVNVDFPGFGRSTEPPEPWGVEQYTACIEALVEAEGIANPSLFGHSFGGRVAIVYASRHRLPGEVNKVILADAAGVKPRRTFGYYRKVYTFKAMKAALELLCGKENARERIDRMRARRGSSDYAAASPMNRRCMSRVVNQDLCHLMPQITAPTLLVWGEEDTATPLADARKMATLIPGAGLVTFPRCGHYSFLDNPLQFCRVLQSFLASR